MVKLVIVSVVSMYVGAGLFAGLLYQRAIPALNPLGVTLVAATWPNQIRCARMSSGCKPVPEWAAPYIFTFSDEPAPGPVPME